MDAATLQRLFAHDAWANRAMAGALAVAAAPPRPMRLLAHVVAGEWLWLSRIRAEPSPLEVWPSLTLLECVARLDAVSREWSAYLAGLSAGEWGRSVAYVNSQGESWSTPVGDVLLHVVLHSSYHRGQAAMALRDGGAEPPYTDYAHCVRQGLI